MSKRSTLNFVVFIVALCALIWHYFFVIDRYLIALPVSFIFAGFVAIVSYILIKLIWLKVDKNFALENSEMFRQEAINYFEKHKLSDGAYFETSLSEKKTIFRKVYIYFLLLLTFLVLLFERISNLNVQITTPLGIVLVVFIIVSILSYFWVFLKKIHFEEDLVKDQIRVYSDHFTLMNSGRSLFFKDINSIEFHHSYGSLYLITHNQGETLRLALFFSQKNTKQENIPRLFESLGFEKVGSEIKSRIMSIIPTEWIDKYIYRPAKR